MFVRKGLPYFIIIVILLYKPSVNLRHVLKKDAELWDWRAFHLLEGLSLSACQMGSTHRCSALGTQTSAGAQTRMVMKLLAHIDGERRNVQLKASESIFTSLL